MDRDRLSDLINDPNMIPGIYNYCDSWCERCTHTLRCATYAMREEPPADPETHDVANEAFSGPIAETFRMTIGMVTEMAEEQGLDLDAIEEDEIMQEIDAQHKAAQAHPVGRAAREYAFDVHDWLKGAADLIERKALQLQQEADLDLPDSQAEDDLADLQDAVEIVEWYQFLIHVKLMRAIEGEIRGRPEIIQDMPKDSDGSAKVALLGIDRSIAAWDRLLRYLPEQEREIQGFLVRLYPLRRSAEEAFPDARAFVRPGFDD